MRGKEFLKSIIMSFFIIVTLINIATFILGTIFQPDLRFGYDAFLSPLIYGVFSLIPFVVMYAKKELTVKELLIRKVLQLLSIEVIQWFLAFGFNSSERGNIKLMVAFSLSILIIYVLVHLITWFLDVQTAKKMTDDLHHYQSNWENGLL
ncbi:MAG TPA: hypothetical protein VJY54_07205 [Lachnospiraceae bacterium]|nr:hypothetical protein [Lachnospiraceae bacterium]